MNYTIRKAEEKDKEQVLALGRKIVDKYERTHLGDDVVNEYIGSGSCDNDFLQVYDNITLLFDDEQLIGFIVTSENEIQGFLIDIPYWGIGAAQYLFNYAVKNIFKNHNEITLECFVNSPRANAFYKKMGFIPGEIVNGVGAERIVYSKKI